MVIMTGVPIDDARAAKALVQKQLSRLPGLVGIGLTRRAGGYAIKVNLAQAVQGAHLPTEVGGVPVVFEIVGIVKAG